MNPGLFKSFVSLSACLLGMVVLHFTWLILAHIYSCVCVMLHILYTYCAGKIENSVTRHLSEQQQQLTRLDVKAAHKRKV